MDFGKIIDTAQKVWDNGGKEIAEKLMTSATSDDKKQPLTDGSEGKSKDKSSLSSIIDTAQKVWDNGGKEIAEKLMTSDTSNDKKQPLTDSSEGKSKEKSGLSSIIDTAQKVWNNGGKEVVEKIVESTTSKDSSKEKNALASAPVASAPEMVNNDAAPEVIEAEVVVETPKKEPKKTSTGINKVHDNMSNEEEDAFINSLQNGFSSVSASNPKEAMQALALFVDATNETIKFVKMQEVKREGILAKRDTELAKIEATKEILKEYLDKTFDERKETFNKYFEIVDAALEKGDNAVLSKALDSINSLATSSPFKDLSNMNTFKEIMANNDEDLDI